MWMGSGLILQTEGGTERPEDMGGRYFVQLARKSFFTFVPTVNPYQTYSTEYYVMHDLLHELARNVSTAKRIGTASEQVENMENLFHLRLTSLQELYNFSIQSQEGYRISSLMNLTSLCKLRLCNLENVERHGEVIEAKINEKSYLRSLSLNWSETNDALKEDNLVLDILEPHARLENLEITGYSGVRFPPWINHPPLVNMVSLELRQCKNWVCLPSLGNLQLLKHLELQNLTGLKQIGQSSGDSLPQNLKTLVVEGCQGLRKLPLLSLTLMQLEINNVGLDILPRIVVHHGNIGSEAMPPKLVSVIISNCSNLTTLAESFLLQEHYICTLQILKIVDCKKLIHAPLSFGSMNDLTEFRIGSCYSLRMMERVDGGLLPCTLKELSMVQCGDLQLPLLNSLGEVSSIIRGVPESHSTARNGYHELHFLVILGWAWSSFISQLARNYRLQEY
nr:putative disease resistance protein RGA4 [Aegilops tauschii subsp. strangulata]